MRRQGFTLIEVVMGIFLVGIICTSILPIITTSFMNISRQKVKADLLYMGEMTIERIKAYRPESETKLYILDTCIDEIICSFSSESCVSLQVCDDTYRISLTKEDISDKLWLLVVKAEYNGGPNRDYVELEAYIPKKEGIYSYRTNGFHSLGFYNPTTPLQCPQYIC